MANYSLVNVTVGKAPIPVVKMPIVATHVRRPIRLFGTGKPVRPGKVK